MKSLIFSIGRNRFYPYVCLILVTIAYVITDPITNFSWLYFMAYLGAIFGLLCVILLAKGRNSGNVFGMVAAAGESSANILNGNLGAALPSFYYFLSHVFGLFSWNKHKHQDDSVITRKVKESDFFYILLFLVVAALINIFLTGALNIENDPYQLIVNCFIFALGVVAQFTMIQRYAFSWYIWIVLNLLVIGLNIYTNNLVIATQYLIYLFNSTYGLLEWQESIKNEELAQ